MKITENNPTRERMFYPEANWISLCWNMHQSSYTCLECLFPPETSPGVFLLEFLSSPEKKKSSNYFSTKDGGFFCYSSIFSQRIHNKDLAMKCPNLTNLWRGVVWWVAVVKTVMGHHGDYPVMLVVSC